jgi:transposase
MPKLITICLTQESQDQLKQIRDTHKCPYMRERATAILKISEGISGRQVALNGLLKRRKPDTVYDWVKRYRSEGIAGLKVKPGRGRKPAYSPRYQSGSEAKEAILHTVRRDPAMFAGTNGSSDSSFTDLPFTSLSFSSLRNSLGSRWSLSRIIKACDWLQISTMSGMSKLLKRLGISYKRGRSYIHSPDPHYRQKMDIIAQCLLKAWYAPDRYVLLYQDEFAYYRQPTIARDYEAMGKYQPLAHRSYHSDTVFKGMGALNPITGQVIYHQASKASIQQLTVFYDMIMENHSKKYYPDLDTIFMVQDNWSVHFHPDVLAHLQPQHLEFPVHVPDHWPKEPTQKARFANLPIKILQLPTYASWANPIEKLWRWVRQTVLHLHRLSDDWSVLKQRVRDFILSFRKGSNELLRYVGLLPD